jgi:hypothetical protein
MLRYRLNILRQNIYYFTICITLKNSLLVRERQYVFQEVGIQFNFVILQK